MRISKDKNCVCNSCAKGRSESVEMFDMRIQVLGQNAIILHFCDRCVSEMFDKTLKAKCMVDGMVKSPKQIAIINGRKRAEMKKRESEEKQELEELKRRYGSGD